MVNPKNVLESPHQLPSKTLQTSKTPFSPLQYLISTHRQAFDAVMKLWARRPLKVYGARMTESVLTILCHILKGTFREHSSRNHQFCKPRPFLGICSNLQRSGSFSLLP